jgi:cytochrome P450
VEADLIPNSVGGSRLSDEQFGRAIPFEAFAALRASQPVYWYEPGKCWVVTSYEHVEKINRDPQLFSSAGGPIPPDLRDSAINGSGASAAL